MSDDGGPRGKAVIRGETRHPHVSSITAFRREDITAIAPTSSAAAAAYVGMGNEAEAVNLLRRGRSEAEVIDVIDQLRETARRQRLCR